ncbi:MAG TPA: hypothetical protein VJL87_00085 [Bdellovibrionota bacterium]|nr:hypothetical protein [Bdellovibrionota bacterium]
MKIFKLSLILTIIILSTNALASNNNPSTQGEINAFFTDSNDESGWDFLDCRHTPIDCELLAWQHGYDEYKYEYRGYPCGKRLYHRFACYGRESE